jgi:hypothetical protein
MAGRRPSVRALFPDFDQLALESADHAAAPRARARRLEAWQMATASASAASAVGPPAVGNMAELQCRRPIGGDEGLLDRRLVRRPAGDHLGHPAVDGQQPLGQWRGFGRADDAVGDVGEARSIDGHHAPAGPAKPGIEAEDAQLIRHLFRSIARERPIEKPPRWLTHDYRG